MKHLKGSWAEDKAMDWTHLESKASRPGFVAGGTSARAHVAGERLAAAPEPRRSSTSAHGPGTPWRLAAEPAGEGGPTARWWGSLAGWREGLQIFYFIFLFYKLHTWNAKPPFIPSGSYEGATGKDNNI